MSLCVALELVVTNRDINLAKVTLDKINAKGYESELKTEVKEAKKVIKELEYLEKV